jgi:hypothetical protein
MSEPIFDENGWCHDMDHPQATSGQELLIFNSYYDEMWISHYLKTKNTWSHPDYGYFDGYPNSILKPVAWKPLGNKPVGY